MKPRSGIAICTIVVSLAISGCATTVPDPSASSSAPPREVPGIRVVNDCGACQVKASIPGLIAEGYNSAAAESGSKIVPAKEVVVSIKEYAARGDAARFLGGAFAGKDEIKAVVAFGDKQFTVEDYYRNAWLGIDHLATKIGRMVFEQVSK